MKSETMTTTILTFRIPYTVKQRLIAIADNATLELRKNTGNSKGSVTVSDVIKNALIQTYGVECE